MKWLAGLFLLFTLVPRGAAAQEPPKFVIEKIVVQGVQRAAGRQIVADESLLKEGQTYSEQELRLAVYRVKRLPFVVDAEFSLRKGSERGAYELVITVEEATPIFFLAEADAQRFTLRYPDRRPQTRTLWNKFASVGGRVFVGSHGLVFGSVEKAQHQDGEFFQAGYTQYDLFGAGSFATVQLNTIAGVKGQDSTQSFLSAGIPLSAAQSLRGTLGWASSSQDIGTDSSDSREVLSSLDWIYDTTDDPLFPSSGTKLDGGVSYDTFRDSFHARGPFPGEFKSSGHFTTIALSGRHHWPVTARQSFEAELDLVRRETQSDNFLDDRLTEEILIAGHAINLWGYEKSQRYGDLRFENAIRVQYGDDSSSIASYHQASADAISSLVYRSRWGVVRASFTYVDLWRNN
jgi:hypothetical protein